MFFTHRADQTRGGHAGHRAMVRLSGPDSGQPATDRQASHTHQSPSDGRDKSADRGPHRGHVPLRPVALSVRHYLQFPLFNWGLARGNSSRERQANGHAAAAELTRAGGERTKDNYNREIIFLTLSRAMHFSLPECLTISKDSLQLPRVGQEDSRETYLPDSRTFPAPCRTFIFVLTLQLPTL